MKQDLVSGEGKESALLRGRRNLWFWRRWLAGLTKEVRRAGGGEGRRQVETYRKRAAGGGESLCEGPGAGPCLEWRPAWLEQSVSSCCLVGLFRSPRDEPDLPERKGPMTHLFSADSTIWVTNPGFLSFCADSFQGQVTLCGGPSWAPWGVEQHPWPPCTRCQEHPQL